MRLFLNLVVMFHHYNCILFIIILPVKKCAYDSEENRMRKESLVDKVQSRQD